ncbi:hypothetical protein J2Z65_004423 [Paenibacillus aceris]|uniref:Type II toxin-antitoxin system RelE/ParE family toxin n=1 Tax=Paenibacillus aceris TaxID=869555 RepID=A0ABS4I314_9BACL|nr:hypothetical protein [Paenibacillus aceris]
MVIQFNLFPLNGSWRFGRDVVHDTIHVFYLIYDTYGDAAVLRDLSHTSQKLK